MFRKIFIGSYIIIFLLCILSKFLLNTDVFLIYFIVTIIIISLLVNICLILKINFICAYIVTIYKRLGYINNNLSYKTEKFFLKTLQFLGLRDLSSTIILIDILTMPILKYYDLDYVYTTNDILLSIQFIIFMVMLGIRIYSASKIKNKI
ncbi:hypothetical protein [Megamonas funiformis]|uniref:hypothetical protein n=1 Tax=Megamonas funiformis TaxID=437897 RepID=UPI00265D7692|nr:hypothetical protein [Megamonas funiformis]